jgi:hypothetical protein
VLLSHDVPALDATSSRPPGFAPLVDKLVYISEATAELVLFLGIPAPCTEMAFAGEEGPRVWVLPESNPISDRDFRLFMTRRMEDLNNLRKTLGQLIDKISEAECMVWKRAYSGESSADENTRLLAAKSAFDEELEFLIANGKRKGNESWQAKAARYALAVGVEAAFGCIAESPLLQHTVTFSDFASSTTLEALRAAYKALVMTFDAEEEANRKKAFGLDTGGWVFARALKGGFSHLGCPDQTEDRMLSLLISFAEETLIKELGMLDPFSDHPDPRVVTTGNSCGEPYCSPLSMAAESGGISAVKLILQRSNKKNVANAAVFAFNEGHYEIFDLLIHQEQFAVDTGCTPQAFLSTLLTLTINEGRPAVRTKKYGMIKNFLLKWPAAVKEAASKGDDTNTPLFRALDAKDHELATLLIAAGAKVAAPEATEKAQPVFKVLLNFADDKADVLLKEMIKADRTFLTVPCCLQPLALHNPILVCAALGHARCLNTLLSNDLPRAEELAVQPVQYHLKDPERKYTAGSSKLTTAALEAAEGGHWEALEVLLKLTKTRVTAKAKIVGPDGSHLSYLPSAGLLVTDAFQRGGDKAPPRSLVSLVLAAGKREKEEKQAKASDAVGGTLSSQEAVPAGSVLAAKGEHPQSKSQASKQKEEETEEAHAGAGTAGNDTSERCDVDSSRPDKGEGKA